MIRTVNVSNVATGPFTNVLAVTPIEIKNTANRNTPTIALK